MWSQKHRPFHAERTPCPAAYLGKTNHIIGEPLEYSVIPASIGVGNIAEFDVSANQFDMITIALDGSNYAANIPEAVATGEYSEHHHKKLDPTRKRIYRPVTTVLLNYSIK